MRAALLGVLALLALCLLAACAVPTTAPDDDSARCEAEGGCHTLTMQMLVRLYQRAFADAQAERCGI